MRVFAKRFYGYDPVARPFVGFGIEGNRDALISASDAGDLLLYVGTHGEPTAENERGRLLGFAEFARVAVDTKDVIEPALLRPIDFKADGSLAWPKALPILRAWLFPEPRFKLIDVLREHLTFEATTRAVLLGEDDTRAVLAIPREEIRLPHNEKLDRAMSRNNALAGSRPTTGPLPTSWEGLVTRNAGQEAWTYALRFGRRNAWKIGHAQDVSERLAQVNQHVPIEELGESWAIFLRQRWPTPQDAYGMEQRIFRSLGHRRTEGERINCTEAELQAAWANCLRESD